MWFVFLGSIIRSTHICYDTTLTLSLSHSFTLDSLSSQLMESIMNFEAHYDQWPNNHAVKLQAKFALAVCEYGLRALCKRPNLESRRNTCKITDVREITECFGWVVSRITAMNGSKRASCISSKKRETISNHFGRELLLGEKYVDAEFWCLSIPFGCGVSHVRGTTARRR